MSRNGPNPERLDEVGDWSVDKLNILRVYSERYALILRNQTDVAPGRRLSYGYIDAFAGAGEHIHKSTGEIIPGSPLNALRVRHAFDEYHFIDLKPSRVLRLRKLCSEYENAFVHEGNCNRVLLEKLLPKFRYEDFRRALCFLDPYGMNLEWEVLETAGKMRSIEIFLNFPILDITRNAKRKSLELVDPVHRARMTAFWGTDDWHTSMVKQSDQQNFFGALLDSGDNTPEIETVDGYTIAKAFQQRLKDVADFQFVPDPVPMRNRKEGLLYFLYFAGNNATGNRIATHILNESRKSRPL